MTNIVHGTGASEQRTKFRFRRRQSPLIVVEWWYMNVLDEATEEVLETFELGEPVEYGRFTMPDGRPSIMWIEKFDERDNKGWILGRIWDHPDLIQADLREIKKLNPLSRLAAEAAR